MRWYCKTFPVLFRQLLYEEVNRLAGKGFYRHFSGIFPEMA